MSRHTDPSSLDTNTCGSPRPRMKHTLLHKDINLTKNIPVNLAKTATALPLVCLNFKMFGLNQQTDLMSAPPCLVWLNLWKASRVQKSCTKSTGQMKAARVDQPQAPDPLDKLLQIYQVESCQQQSRFSSCKHLSLVSFVNSFQRTVKVRVMAPLNQ